MTERLQVQLWSYHYSPEPMGVGPIAAVWAHAMQERGHAVEVVTAHPHYPSPMWGRRLSPYRELREGIPVLRLPLATGRTTTGQRLRKEGTFTAAQTLAAPWLGTPDVLVAVSPSLPALAPAILNARARRIPWVLWLQDLVLDGAISTGLLEAGMLGNIARRLEQAAYRSADRVVSISAAFEERLRSQGVPSAKLRHIYNPSTRYPEATMLKRPPPDLPRRVLYLGNIGHSQGLDRVVRQIERTGCLEEADARMVIGGEGVTADRVRAEIASDRIEAPRLLSDQEVEAELRAAHLGVLTQRPDVAEFNMPSRLMNFMAFGVPIIASVRRDSEVARVIAESGAGWVTDANHPEQFGGELAMVLADPEELHRRGSAAAEFARTHFSPQKVAAEFERVLRDVAP